MSSFPTSWPTLSFVLGGLQGAQCASRVKGLCRARRRGGARSPSPEDTAIDGQPQVRNYTPRRPSRPYPSDGALMNEMNCYVFTTEPDAVAHTELVELCCCLASKFILVVRDPERDPGARIEQKLARLSKHRLETMRAHEWPGTILLGDDALVHWHRVEPGVQRALQELASHLFEWVHPALPEDPCFFRADGRVLLVTTSHERDAYLTLTEHEHRALTERAPAVAAILRLEGDPS